MTDAEINKAVAEAAGYKNVNDSGTYGNEETDGPLEPRVSLPVYTQSLDAIVPVVREWCAKLPYKEHQWGIAGTTASGIIRARVLGEVEHDTNPARALCLAFLQAVEAAKETP